MSTGELTWFKSSRSTGDNDSCVEVALAWRKSSYSGADGDECVEVASCPGTVHVRDSKVAAGPQLDLSPAAWSAFLAHTTTR
ncbi:DUF397 domain-containing protein [Streptomyces sp. HNM0574]|uniref:DUF397 domain-containing protein n=1 Tax=Streptomyces sp. HNM0574 TaxID=2714954 RepID=UPI00146AAD21|nr:DUF397 domain-containing protein [Streptomyces sp. HNM0574]NLU65956.1 DUF397 domain-containing protein [Streptomyces sp. HNM0574]